jgi:hypothetical protein
MILGITPLKNPFVPSNFHVFTIMSNSEEYFGYEDSVKN